MLDHRTSNPVLPHVLRMALMALICVLSLSNPAKAQNGDPSALESARLPYTVGVYVHPPFVMQEEIGVFSGMAIELWEYVSGRLDIQSEYVEFHNVGELVDALETRQIDAAVTNLTTTHERAERIDFTHPWFDAGQRILVEDGRGEGPWNLFRGLYDTGHLTAYAWIAMVIVLATFVVTVFDRYFDKDFPRTWRDGVAESFYTVMSVATSGRTPERKNLFGWAGRIWQGLWLVCGIAVLAYVTSSVTSVMTTLSLTSQINSVADLPGRRVGVQPGSVSEISARDMGLNLRPIDHIDEAVDALLQRDIDAVIGDAPVLEYYVLNNPQRPLAVVGSTFAPDKYAFGLVRESEMTRPLTVELIGAHENGLIEDMRERYLGRHP